MPVHRATTSHRQHVANPRAHGGALIGEAEFSVLESREAVVHFPPVRESFVEPGEKTAGVPLEHDARFRPIGAEPTPLEVAIAIGNASILRDSPKSAS